MNNIVIRKYSQEDGDQVWKIIEKVISTGDTYVFDPDSDRKKMMGYWTGNDKHTYIALIDEKVAGTFIIKQNQPDLGSHIANASYMTDPDYSGKGIGTAMGSYSLVEAKRLGFYAMQFNIVVSSNTAAIQLWEKLGFKIIGTIPEAFDSQKFGLTDAHIMFRKL